MKLDDTFRYVGQELDLFAHASNWKKYWGSRIEPWIRGDVLEVGAGLGTNTVRLKNSSVRSWKCLEPDPELNAQLADTIAGLPFYSAAAGTIRSVGESRFDSILYIDVLEHIEADKEELAMAAQLLRRGGHIVVLSPAHQFLFSEFDRGIGHYRRYNKAFLKDCSPPGCRLETMFYLDSAGMLASLTNSIMLHQSKPTLRQIKFWDKYIVPTSQVLDPVINYRLGKTIVGVWTNSKH